MNKNYMSNPFSFFKTRAGFEAFLKKRLDEDESKANFVKDDDIRNTLLDLIMTFREIMPEYSDKQILRHSKYAFAMQHDLLQIGLCGNENAKLTDWNKLYAEDEDEEYWDAVYGN